MWDKLKCNNVTNKYNHHYKIKLQHRNSTLSDNPHASVIIKRDSAASNNYFTENDKHLLTDIRYISIPITVILPDRDSIIKTIEGNISILTLSQQATNSKIFPKLNYSLISLGQLYDVNCIVTLNK